MTCFTAAGSGQNKSALENIGEREINRAIRPSILSIDDELALGQVLSKEFERSVKLNSDAGVLALVERVAQILARNSDAKVPIIVKVIDKPDINVTALPGGYAYVTSGLIRTAASEAELASALAHGIAHVAARHAVERRGLSTFVGLLPSSQVFSGGIAAATIQNAAAVQIPAMLYSFARGAVDEADRLGLQYLYRAGYDPSAAVTFLEKVEALSPASSDSQAVLVFDSYLPRILTRGNSMSSLFQTHPPLRARITKIRAAVRQLPPRETHVVTTGEFDSLRLKFAQ
jgi:predicted Zn-dependent protease